MVGLAPLLGIRLGKELNTELLHYIIVIEPAKIDTDSSEAWDGTINQITRSIKGAMRA